MIMQVKISYKINSILDLIDIKIIQSIAALYWCTRMMVGGEDPRYICRRLVRAASEDIGVKLKTIR